LGNTSRGKLLAHRRNHHLWIHSFPSLRVHYHLILSKRTSVSPMAVPGVIWVTTLNIQENIPLAPLTTFQVGGPARYFVEARDEREVKSALALAAERRWPLFVLGGGSNLVISDSGWPGLVLRIAIAGVETECENGKMLYSAGAGESWDNLVALAVSETCSGLECMSGIPGTVGGTPVQNVGAYGQEVSQTIIRVRALEIATARTRDLSNLDCGFAYR